jgi:hypothetical protein
LTSHLPLRLHLLPCRVEVFGFALRMSLTLVNTFITNQKWMAALMCIISWCLFFIYWWVWCGDQSP